MRDLVDLQRLFQVALHQLQRIEHERGQVGVAVAQRHVLQRVGLAALRHQQMGHLFGQIPAARRAAEQPGHHVERAHPAAAGVAVAVDLEQSLRHLQGGEMLEQALAILPVDGAAVVVQQPGLRQIVGAGVHAADGGASRRLPAQPGDDLGEAASRDGVGADDEGRVEAQAIRQTGVGHDADAVARHHGLTRQPDRDPLVGLALEDRVGQSQRVHHRGERDQRELRHEQQAVALGRWHVHRREDSACHGVRKGRDPSPSRRITHIIRRKMAGVDPVRPR